MVSKQEIEVAAQEIYQQIGITEGDDGSPENVEYREISRETAKAALEAAEKVRWQPIETAPKDGTLILGYGTRRPFSKKYDINIIQWINNEDIIEWEGFTTGQVAPYPVGTKKLMSFGVDNFFTHWMPLPTPPEGEE